VAKAACADNDPASTVNVFHQALARGDKEAALATLMPDVLVYESGNIERSRDEYGARHLPGDIAFSRATQRKVLRSDSRIDGKLAVVAQEVAITGRYRDVRLVDLETTVLERVDGRWRIRHVHWSARKIP
jgi:ketosteroid isomerase-like protein